jgi:hypothetical protein
LHHRLLATLFQQIVEGLDSQGVEGCISLCCQDPQLSPAVQVHTDEQSLERAGISGFEASGFGLTRHSRIMPVANRLGNLNIVLV